MTKKATKFFFALGSRKRVIFWSLLSLACLLFAAYVLSINLTVFGTAKRANLEKEINLLHLQIGQLEFDLLSKKNEINSSLAKSFGFEEADRVRFISRKSVATILGMASIQ